MTTPTQTPNQTQPGSPERPARSISVRTRLALLFGLTGAVVAAIFAAVQWQQGTQVDLIMKERAARTAAEVAGILDLKASGARIHADDYTRWDDFVTFTKKRDPRWGRINLTESINTFALDVAWVLDDRGRLFFTANPSEDPALAPLPVSATALASSLREQPIRHFFARTKKGLLEVWTSSIQPSDDFTRKAPVSGYYIIGRLWTKERIAEFARLTHGHAVLEAPGAQPEFTASSKTGEIEVNTPLRDLAGAPIAMLDFRTTYTLAPQVHDALLLSLVLMVLGALLSFGVLGWGLRHWIARPLSMITDSLRREDPALLRHTTELRDEFGELGRLVRDFFEQQKSLIEAREAAEVATRAKSQFLANISHELRTPMHGVLSYARFGGEEALTAERSELLDYFHQIDESGKTLLTLLDDLLDLAKFEAGRMKLELASVEIGAIAKEAAVEFDRLYSERKLTLQIRLEDGIPEILMDRMKIRQVLRNLLSNAAKFTPAGGDVTIRAAVEGRCARIAVEDSGPGVPLGELEIIFEKFTQATNASSRSGGTGLGLSLCREIVEAHGGRIWAEHREPRGTRFTFELPVDGPDSAHLEADAEPPGTERPGDAAA